MKTTLKALLLILANAALVGLLMFFLLLTVELGLELNPFTVVPLVWAYLCGCGICRIQEMLLEDEEMESELID